MTSAEPVTQGTGIVWARAALPRWLPVAWTGIRSPAWLPASPTLPPGAILGVPRHLFNWPKQCLPLPHQGSGTDPWSTLSLPVLEQGLPTSTQVVPAVPGPVPTAQA